MSLFFQVAQKLKDNNIFVSSLDVSNVTIWGNHSSTQYPDVNHASVNIQGKAVPVREAVKDDSYLNTSFIEV